MSSKILIYQNQVGNSKIVVRLGEGAELNKLVVVREF